MDESIPETQPDGAFPPPPGVPPGANATSQPEPPQRPRMLPTLRRDSETLLNRALDKLDSIADEIATRAGLR